MNVYSLGWDAGREQAARHAWQATGRFPLLARADLDRDERPLPAAFSLSGCVLWWYDQGEVGSCFANAAAQAMQVATAAAITSGEPFEAVQLSRHMAWVEGRRRDGTLGKRGDGGTIHGVMRALHEVGLCRETLAPYRPYRTALERVPSEDAYADAQNNRLTGVLPFQADDAEGRKRALYNGLPIVPGIWWPEGWDGDLIDEQGRTRGIGQGGYGHALVNSGWADPGVFDDDHLWWEYINSHGPIYPVLPAEWAARVAGYRPARPERAYQFWVRADLEARIMSSFHELIGVSGVAGFRAREVRSWGDAFA